MNEERITELEHIEIENLLCDALAVVNGIVSVILLGVWDWCAYLFKEI